jgi:hypothetical protein
MTAPWLEFQTPSFRVASGSAHTGGFGGFTTDQVAQADAEAMADADQGFERRVGVLAGLERLVVLFTDPHQVAGAFLRQAQAFAFLTQTALELSQVRIHRPSLATWVGEHHLFYVCSKAFFIHL